MPTMTSFVWVLVIVAAVAIGTVALIAVRRTKLPASVKIVHPEGPPTLDAEGAARSVQAAEITLSETELERLWSAATLEQLARTYWRFLQRVTLGIVRVSYSDAGRALVLVSRPLVLLSFDAPEYELHEQRGIVRWRIRGGMLVSRHGRSQQGALQIDVRQMAEPGPGLARLHVEVAVSSFYPSIAAAIGRRAYNATQSAIHVVVTHAFLRSLARLELSESKAGRLAAFSRSGHR